MSLIIAVPAPARKAKTLRLPSAPIVFTLILAMVAIVSIFLGGHTLDQGGGSEFLFGP